MFLIKIIKANEFVMLGNIKHHINISMSWINDHYYYYIKLTIVVFI